MSAVRAGRVSKHRRGRRAARGAVLRMMAIMTDRQNNEEVPKEFLETGRTGRRNAMPDILHTQDAEVTTADLPSRLQQLATSEPDNPQPSTSKTELAPSQTDESGTKSCS